jgi:hypothetical protein
VPPPSHREVYSFDFGTTYSTAGRIKLKDRNLGKKIHENNIQFIREYPGKTNGGNTTYSMAPSMLYCPEEKGTQMWGWDVFRDLVTRTKKVPRTRELDARCMSFPERARGAKPAYKVRLAL